MRRATAVLPAVALLISGCHNAPSPAAPVSTATTTIQDSGHALARFTHEHRHTGIGLHTPADVHFGLATDKAADRRAALIDARARHPHRFGTTHAPKILDLPDTAWINRPAENTAQEADTTAA